MTEAETETSLLFILTTFNFAFTCFYIASPSAKKAQASSISVEGESFGLRSCLPIEKLQVNTGIWFWI